MSNPNKKPPPAADKRHTNTELPDGADDIEGGEVEKPGQSERDEKRSDEERT
jgi:hypothetical protein